MNEVAHLIVAGVAYDVCDETARALGSSTNALPLPVYLSKGGNRYKLDVVDDEEGIDLVLSKE